MHICIDDDDDDFLPPSSHALVVTCVYLSFSLYYYFPSYQVLLLVHSVSLESAALENIRMDWSRRVVDICHHYGVYLHC